MWVFGGINNNGKFLNDLWRYNLKNRYWEQQKINVDDFPILKNGIAFHSCCVVFMKFKKKAGILFNWKKNLDAKSMKKIEEDLDT